MSYLVFLLVFLVPPLFLLFITRPSRLPNTNRNRRRWSLPLVCLLALVYTTPWDNFLVYKGVWSYGTDRVLATIGYVPVEEYAFFILQPLLTGMVVYHMLARLQSRPLLRSRKVRIGGAVVYGVLAVSGITLLIVGGQALYMGLILAWAAPVLLGMWLYAGGYLWRYRSTLLWATALPTLYLWIIDRLALGLGIWDISNTYSFDIDPFGLPIEEATFFLMTNLLVTHGLLLFLFGHRITLSKL